MAHDGIGPGGDEPVVFAHGELEGEEQPEVAVAGEADEGARCDERPSEKEARGHPDLVARCRGQDLKQWGPNGM